MLLWWPLAGALHLAWVPNVLFLLGLDSESPDLVVVEVDAVGLVPSSFGEGAHLGRTVASERLVRQSPGVAPGGSVPTEAEPWLEHGRDVPFVRTVAAASRSLRSAAHFQPESPARSGERASPRGGAARPEPGHRDLETRGRVEAMDSFAPRAGARGRADAAVFESRAGASSTGRVLPVGEGSGRVVAPLGGGQDAHRSRVRGGEPVSGRPAVTEAPEAAEAEREGPLGGTVPLRQASPRVALAPSVREARLASGPYGRDEAGASRARLRSLPGVGDGTRGPGRGGRGEGEAGEGSSREPLFDEYLRGVLARIKQQWRSYPEQLAYDLQQGLVVLEVWVGHDGRLERVEVQRSSGFAAFDQGAVEAVRRAAPLGPPPPELLFRRGRDHIVLSLPMRYRNPMFE